MARNLVEHPVRNWTLPDWFLTERVAAITRWTPCRPHLGNMRSAERSLVVVDNHRLVWKMLPDKSSKTRQTLCFLLLILFLGIVLMCMVAVPILGLLICLPVGLFLSLLSSIAIWGVYSSRRPAIFDQNHGYSIGTRFHLFSSADCNVEATEKAKTVSPRRGELGDIHAVQVISKIVKGGMANKSYELNIVLKSGIRVAVIDHNDAAVIREEASTLATFLKVPVWDDSDRGFWRFLLTEKLSVKMSFLWAIKRAAPGDWLFLHWNAGSTATDNRWELGYAHLLNYVETNGNALMFESEICDDHFFRPFKLGKWVAQQLAEIETLSPEQRRRLESLPGWAGNEWYRVGPIRP